MRRAQALLLPLAALVLLGQGCVFPGSRSTSSATDGGVFRTADAGDSWTQLAALPAARAIGSIAGANILALEADPQDAAVLYAGTRENGLIFSLDGAAAWQRPRLDVLREGAITDVEVDPQDVCTVYVVKGQRLYKTEDCLRSFNQDVYVETRANVRITDVAVDWYNPSIVWLGESNGDLHKSEDGGRTWRRVFDNRSAVSTILVHAGDSRRVLVGTEGNGFFRTDDAGQTWTQIRDQLRNMRGSDTVRALAQDNGARVAIAATSYGLLRSVDFGETWEPLQLLTAPGQVDIRAVAVGPERVEDIAYAVTGTFYRTTDGGQNWTTDRLPSTRVPSHLLNDPTAPNAYFLGVAAAER